MAFPLIYRGFKGGVNFCRGFQKCYQFPSASSPLRVFQNKPPFSKTTQITVNHTNNPPYEVEPLLDIPIILSNAVYLKHLRPGQPQKTNPKCTDYQYHLIPSLNETAYKNSSHALPQRLNCLATVYIDPIGCPIWDPGIIVIPILRHQDLVLDKRLQDDSRRNLPAILKSGWFAIHVVNADAPATLQSDEDIFFLMDYYFLTHSNYVIKTKYNNYVGPTKLLFRLQHSHLTGNNHHKVAETYLASFNSKTGEYFEQLQSKLSNCRKIKKMFGKSGSSGRPQRCLLDHSSEEFSVVHMTLYPYRTSDIESLSKLEKFHSHLDNLFIINEGSKNLNDLSERTAKFASMKLINLYLDTWTRSIFDLDEVFISILFPNSTLITEVQLVGIRYMPTVYIFKFLNGTVYFFQPEVTHLHFVTCTQINEWDALQLTGYISAFDGCTWILLLLTCFISGITLNFISNWRNGIWCGSLTSQHYYERVTFTFNILLCQGTPAIKYSKWICGTWILVGILFSYGYQGSNIMKLIAPLARRTVDTFNDVVARNLSLYSPIDSFTVKAMLRKENYTKSQYKTSRRIKPSKLERVLELIIRGHNGTVRNDAENLKRNLYSAKNLKDVRMMHETDYYFEKISKCDNVAYVDTYEEVLVKHERLKSYITKQKPGKKNTLSLSKKPYTQTYQNWDFKNMPLSATQFSMRLRSVSESGLEKLWSLWSKWIAERRYMAITTTRKNHPEKLDLGSNVVVVFYLCLGLIYVCV
ncbi:unnamed protein product [Orchesella dallaii]|uniref:Uncharacterized protein n=1 Tax=Orchesella dallaii TaxID=48710 RepID=A0ABP1S8M0_9HEXA